jgi:hypothetical protein
VKSAIPRREHAVFMFGEGGAFGLGRNVSIWLKKHALPRRSIAVCFTLLTGICPQAQTLLGRANCALMYRSKQHGHSSLR